VRREYPLVRLLLLGTSADSKVAARLQELAQIDVENRVGATDLSEYVAAIAASNLVICNDTSAYHIAMALGRRVLCFLGGGHFGWFAPYPPAYSSNAIVLSTAMECFWCNWECRYPREAGGAFRCVASIPVEAAVRSISLLMGGPNA
jgi:ADP-heptose:LPS heptosyltransferase